MRSFIGREKGVIEEGSKYNSMLSSSQLKLSSIAHRYPAVQVICSGDEMGTLLMVRSSRVFPRFRDALTESIPFSLAVTPQHVTGPSPT
jgi:hypothetical protein